VLLVLPMSSESGKERRAPRTPRKRAVGEPAQVKADSKDVPVPDLTGRADQLGAIIVKTLDLAEAGLSLGITVLTRAGAAAQEALGDRAAAAPDGRGTPEVSHPRAVEEPAADEAPFFLANRVPLAPGGEVYVSFSITNDSLVEPKRVSLQVGDFVGESEGTRIASDAFAVRPARKTIAPMDFDKFVLAGTIPAAAPADVYRGTVIVGSLDELSIPVRLLVTAP
jgi:hypothetical protein